MRGKAASNRVDMDSAGITPAYAGKRALVAVLVTMPKDHPRLCGEKITHHFPFCRKLGSPPPMRGKAEIPAWDYLT